MSIFAGNGRANTFELYSYGADGGRELESMPIFGRGRKRRASLKGLWSTGENRQQQDSAPGFERWSALNGKMVYLGGTIAGLILVLIAP